MSHKIFVATIAGALLLVPAAAHASAMTGSFSGTMSSGTDTTGVFGPSGADLTNDTVTGTFSYDTSLFSQVVAAGINTATATGVGALTVTVTIGGNSHTFTDNTSSSILLDTNASDVTIQNANNIGTAAENFFLDASDLFTPFISSTDLTQGFTTTDPFSSTGTFVINDTGPNVAAGRAFTLGTLTVQPALESAVPEPASLGLLIVGLFGVAAGRARATRRQAGN